MGCTYQGCLYISYRYCYITFYRIFIGALICYITYCWRIIYCHHRLHKGILCLRRSICYRQGDRTGSILVRGWRQSYRTVWRRSSDRDVAIWNYRRIATTCTQMRCTHQGRLYISYRYCYITFYRIFIGTLICYITYVGVSFTAVTLIVIVFALASRFTPPLAVPPSSSTWNVNVAYGLPFAFAAGLKTNRI